MIFRIRDYQAFISDLRDLTASAEKVLIPKQFSYSGGSSYAVYNSVINQIDLKLGYLIKISKKKIDCRIKEISLDVASFVDESSKEYYRGRGDDCCSFERQRGSLRLFIFDG